MSMLELPIGELFYETKGSGPPLVFLHAGIADSRMWDPQIDHFANSFQVVRCDLRGYGQSLLPNGEFSYHEDVLKLIESLGSSPVWLVGASFGGRVAIDFALAYPKKVSGLVLVASAVGGFMATAEVARFNEREEVLLEEGKLEEATELNLRMWVDGPHRDPESIDPSIRKLVGEMQLQAFQHPEPELISLAKQDLPPAIERLHEIVCPVLVLSGDLDAPEFVALSELLAKGIPHAKYHAIEGAAHLVSMEAPTQFNKLVRGFIAAEGEN